MKAIDELISTAQTSYDGARTNKNGHSRSWEHYYRVFRDARTNPSPDYDYLSLYPTFYLASRGTYRGSSFLLQKDYKVLSPAVEEILKPKYSCLFRIAYVGLWEGEVQTRLTEVDERISAHFWSIHNDVAGCTAASPMSPVLITEILMGTFGCVLAYDRFFVDGIRTYRAMAQEYDPKSVLKLADSYETHDGHPEEARRGMQTGDLTYPQMKLLDMEF